ACTTSTRRAGSALRRGQARAGRPGEDPCPGTRAVPDHRQLRGPREIATPTTGQEDQDPHQAHRPGVPLGRPGDAREVASVIAFLASPGPLTSPGQAGPSTAE